jgi:hypothetical protein
MRPAPATVALSVLGPPVAMPAPNRLPSTIATTAPPVPARPPQTRGDRSTAPPSPQPSPGSSLLAALRSPPPTMRSSKRRRVTFDEPPPSTPSPPTDSPPRLPRPYAPRSPSAVARASHEACFRARANAHEVGTAGFIGSNEPHLTQRRYLRDAMGGSLFDYLLEAGLFSTVPSIADLFANDISAEEILDFAGSLTALQVSRRQAYYATLVRLGVPRECDLRAWDVLTVERA